MEIKLQNIHMLYLLWLVPFLVIAYVYAGQKRRTALKLFIDVRLLDRIAITVSNARRQWKAALLVMATVFLILAMTRPGWNPRPETIQRRGRDVVFLLDVSKSMLAEDLVPNRLERAKLAIRDCIELIEGDRVALVAFSGTSAIKCPLTLDYGFFRMMLSNISTDSIARGGTMLGDAVRKVINDVFDDQVKEFKDIVLITDGEDHDSFPLAAANSAGDKGIRLIAVGLGDENEGRRIPVTNQAGRKSFLTYNGQEVWSKLDADTLRKMVNVTPGGRYLNVSTGTIDLGSVYQNLIADAEKKLLESETIKRYEEKFQIFVAIAFFLICLETITSERRQEKTINA
jgi:Ca-activated chloride channel family protein